MRSFSFESIWIDFASQVLPQLVKKSHVYRFKIILFEMRVFCLVRTRFIMLEIFSFRWEVCFFSVTRFASSLRIDFCFFFMGTMLRSRQRDSFVLIVSMEGDLDTSLCFLSQKDDECYSSKVFWVRGAGSLLLLVNLEDLAKICEF